MIPILIFILSTLLLTAADQWVKHWAATVLQPLGTIPILDGLLRFAYVENRGAAFGLLQNGRWFFVPLTLVFVGLLLFYYIRLPKERKYWAVRVPLILICAGAVGNFIDRLINGYVVDMLEFLFISFPVFNLADILLVSGTFLLAFIWLFVIKEPA